jgi:hypothetical protein
MVICHFLISILKDYEIYHISKIVPGGISWPVGPTGKLFLPREKKEVGPLWMSKEKSVIEI